MAILITLNQVSTFVFYTIKDDEACLSYTKMLSNSTPNHIAQNKLTERLLNNLLEFQSIKNRNINLQNENTISSNTIFFNTEFERFEKQTANNTSYPLKMYYNNNNKKSNKPIK